MGLQPRLTGHISTPELLRSGCEKAVLWAGGPCPGETAPVARLLGAAGLAGDKRWHGPSGPTLRTQGKGISGWSGDPGSLRPPRWREVLKPTPPPRPLSERFSQQDILRTQRWPVAPGG